MQHRTLKMQSMQTRERDGGRYLEGHFAVFDREYKVFGNWVETIAPGAFSKTLANGGDIKALWNHNSDIVLGSTSAGTATYREDDSGLWGSILVNEQDQDAVNAHARVSRGDVDGCSIGFDIVRQEEWWEGNIYHTKILEVELYECSPCTFPAYKDTDISARAKANFDSVKAQFEKAQATRHDKWRADMLARLKGAK